MAVEVEGAVARQGSSDPQRHPHHQYPYYPFLEIVVGLLVDDCDDEAELQWAADSSVVAN